MPQQTTAYIAIGSNIDPRENIRRGLDLLGSLPDSRLVSESGWYATKPWGIEAQADFINLVVALATGLSARDLLGHTQDVEQQLDRVRAVKNGPRTIDLDLLLFGGAVIDEPDLQVPHPALLERDFMLTPLLDIAADVKHPLEQRALRELTDRIRYRQIIERLQ
jgi:2-amino-4-hydroxy-6-hydroxymethyldihydropteridine diphosphokinase